MKPSIRAIVSIKFSVWQFLLAGNRSLISPLKFLAQQEYRRSKKLKVFSILDRSLLEVAKVSDSINTYDNPVDFFKADRWK